MEFQVDKKKKKSCCGLLKPLGALAQGDPSRDRAGVGAAVIVDSMWDRQTDTLSHTQSYSTLEQPLRGHCFKLHSIVRPVPSPPSLSSHSPLETTSLNTLSPMASHKSLLFTSSLTNMHPSCLENSPAVQNTQPTSPLK